MQKRSQRLWPFMTKIRGRTLSKKFLLTVSRDLGVALYIFWFKVKIKMMYFIFLVKKIVQIGFKNTASQCLRDYRCS